MQNPNKHPQKNKQKMNGVDMVLVGFVIFWVTLLVLLPMVGILKEAIGAHRSKIIASLGSPGALHSFWVTFKILVMTISINVVFGTILAIVIVKHRFRGKLIFESLLDLPFAVSPVVVGFMLIVLFGNKGWFGGLLDLFDIKVLYSLPAMVIATLFVTLPFVAKEIIPVLRECGVEQEEAAYVLGSSRLQTFLKITLPSIKWGLIYGIILTFARSIGEFGAVLVVSGNIINQTQSATIYIHDQFTDLNMVGAFSASFFLLIISLLFVFIINFILKRERRLR